eukprot:GHVU01230790.1.p1 GENE.GHVU01230790.1~~GHVU01230790.1.p1  ORF type:complete len:2480 (+),score=363.92 GHVU01230790.1:158-7597(+)
MSTESANKLEVKRLTMERQLSHDADWKMMQKNTFTRWCNEHLKNANKRITYLDKDFSDGLNLIALIEVLAGHKFKRINKKPNFRTQKLENVTNVLEYLEHGEGIKLVSIDSSDIVDQRLKLILGLIWTLILHYSISMPMWEGEEEAPQKPDQTPKQRLLAWVQNKIPDRPITNFTTDWNDGTAIGALVDSVAPGLCPDWEDWEPKTNKKNATEAMDAAEQWLEVPQLIRPEEMTNPKVDELSMMTYLSQFPNAKLKPGAPLRPRTNPARVRAYGPGIEPTGNCVGAHARFVVETFSAGRGEVEVIILNPKGQREPCEIAFNNDRNLTYSVVYRPTMEGMYRVVVKFASREIPKSPFDVHVEGQVGDAGKVSAAGPGLEKSGVMVNQRTYFEVYTKDAGVGIVDVAILDPKGRKDSVRPTVIKRTEELWYVEYTPKEEGLHSINIFFAGKAIPKSPFGVGVSPEGGPVPVSDNVPDPVTCEPVEGARSSLPPTPRGGVPFAVDEAPIKPVSEPKAESSAPRPMQQQPTSKIPMAKPPVDGKKCYATGRGIQPKGNRIGDNADFKVHTKGAGDGDLNVKVIGPGGNEERIRVKKLDPNTFECGYVPNKVGTYIVNITYGGQPISKSPFKVDVGPQRDTKIRAYGPGLEGGVVGYSACFTVETNGETGALGFSIEGPSQAKIDCKDNGDGSADITYWPTQAGEYAVHILCNEEDIPKSPYMAEIQPNPGTFDPNKVVATGPGLEKTGVTVNKWAEFSVDTRRAGRAPLKVTCMDADYNSVDVIMQDNHDGTYWCRYMPKKNIKHTVTITYGMVNIPNSPYRVFVQEASNPSKVRVYGPAIEGEVETFTSTHLIVDCSEAGPGDVAIALTDERGLDVPVKTTDNKNNTFRIEFEARSVGTYNACVFFADQEIPTSPYKVQVKPSIDVSKVHVQGLENKIPVGKEHDFDIITTGAGKGEVQVNLVSPSGMLMAAHVEETVDGYAAKFTCYEPGPHQVQITFAGQPVKGSPYVIEAVQQGAQTPTAGDAGKVKAYGPGLTGGTANSPAEFTIDTREAGSGGLGLTIEGPCEAKIECLDKGDGTCNVKYWPVEPGEYTINISFADKPIPNSPFKSQIMPSKRVDVSGIKAYGPGLQPSGVFLESTTDFTVDARSVSHAGDGKVKAFVTAPTGTRMEALVNNNNDGTYRCMYTPFEQGSHKIDVTYEGLQIPKSPFPVNAVPGCDPTRVKAYGPGLQGGVTHVPQTFTVETRGAGQGGLGLAIEGPSEAKMTCKDNRDGSCTVEYLPTKKGEYEISVKFADQHIPGSTFRVGVADSVDPTKVQCYGAGIDPKGVRSGQPATFTVDASQAGEAPVEATITNPRGQKTPAQLVHVGDGVYDATYYPDVEGPCKVEVKCANQCVPGSPFQTFVKPSWDATRVRVTGDGVKPHGVVASMPVSFEVDTRDAGNAELDVVITDKDGQYVRPKIVDCGDGRYTVSYTPDDVGMYNVNVTYGGRPVPGAPYKVRTSPSGDASKVKIPDGIRTTIPVGEECVITVNTEEAGQGNVTCRIRSNSTSDIDIDIIDNGDGTVSLMYTPCVPGAYTLNIKFGGQPVPNGQITQQADVDVIVPETSSTQESVPPEIAGLYHPVDFTIPVGPVFNFVSALVTTPSGKKQQPKIVDNKDGTVKIKYQPSEVGLHTLDVKYNNVPITGSPFKFHVDAINSGFVTAHGPGLSHGQCAEPAQFTIVTKDAGAGGLALAVEGPSKAEIHCVDNKDGTCSVSYTPTKPGEYNVIIKFADKHISGSPFSASITGADLEAKRAQLSVGSSSEVSLKVSETDLSNLTATIKSPSGMEEPCILKRLANGHLGISFTPREIGEHLVNVYRHGKHIPNSPFKIYVGESEIGNASKVKVSGKGLHEGMANEINEFTVNTKEAGYGGLSLSIEGPSKADIECHDNEDGSCRVTYKPTEPGNYIINVKFADEHVPGSPYMVKVGGEASGRVTERITRQREAADVTHIGSQCELSLKIPGTSPFDMEAMVTAPSGITEMCDILDLDDSHYSIKFIPKEMGIHTVSVKHKGLHIPGSPFQFTVGPITDGGAHKVRAIGEGLIRGEVNKPCHFNIFTREAGAGGLSIAVEGPSKAEIDFQDRKDGSCGVAYTCTEPGEYLVSVRFNDQHIPDSPFKVYIAPSVGDSRKLTIDNLADKSLMINQPAAFTVDTHGALGKLDARVVSPSGAEDEAIIQEVDKDKYAVRFIPRENGLHYIHVRLNGNHIPDSPFRVMVGKQDADASLVRAYGEGLVRGRTGELSKFIVNTVNAGSGALAVTVDGPSKVQLNCREIEEGYEFMYSPNAPGDYLVTIKYAGNTHIPGSPFKVTVHGPGRVQQGSWSEQSQVVVETVTKTSTTQKYAAAPALAKSDATKVQSQGMGLQKAFVNKEATFQVDTSKAGNNVLLVGVMGPNTPCEEVHIRHKGNNIYNVSYIVKERGNYVLIVKWGDEHIPGSPFHVNVQ